MVLDTERDVMDFDTVKAQFAATFRAPAYDGSYGTELSHKVRQSFYELTKHINWSQVHGDFKDVVKRGLFQPYPYWPELYSCCQSVVQSHAELGTQFLGDYTRARMMGEVMALLRAKYGHDVPRWWLPIMNLLRGKKPYQASHG
jgi:hypothetical protein